MESSMDLTAGVNLMSFSKVQQICGTVQWVDESLVFILGS